MRTIQANQWIAAGWQTVDQCLGFYSRSHWSTVQINESKTNEALIALRRHPSWGRACTFDHLSEFTLKLFHYKYLDPVFCRYLQWHFRHDFEMNLNSYYRWEISYLHSTEGYSSDRLLKIIYSTVETGLQQSITSITLGRMQITNFPASVRVQLHLKIMPEM